MDQKFLDGCLQCVCLKCYLLVKIVKNIVTTKNIHILFIQLFFIVLSIVIITEKIYFNVLIEIFIS